MERFINWDWWLGLYQYTACLLILGSCRWLNTIVNIFVFQVVLSCPIWETEFIWALLFVIVFRFVAPYTHSLIYKLRGRVGSGGLPVLHEGWSLIVNLIHSNKFHRSILPCSGKNRLLEEPDCRVLILVRSTPRTSHHLFSWRRAMSKSSKLHLRCGAW